MAAKGERAERKFTPEARKAVLKAVSDGLPYKHCASLAGISYRTLKHWLTRGRRDEDGPYVAFLALVKKAQSKAVQQAVKGIRTAGKKNWTAYAWFLERTNPEQFGSEGRELRLLRKEVEEQRKTITELKDLIHANRGSPRTGETEPNRNGAVDGAGADAAAGSPSSAV